MKSGLPAVGSGAGGRGVTATQPAARNPALARFDLPATAARLGLFIERSCAWGEADVFAADGQFECSTLGEVIVLPRASLADKAQAAADLARLLEPAPIELAGQKLAELRALTAHRARDGVDVELIATAYTQRLAQYPADVVAAACDAWANREQWWPTWAELKAECDKRMRGRLALRRALS
jgi:hypothetical protein